MTPHLMKLLGLSAALLAISNGVRADEVQAPSFTAQPCCQLCPEAHDASRYTTRYQQNFTTLVQAQGDWLFRTQEDLRTEFNTTAAGYRRLKQLHDAFKSKGVELVVVYQPTRGLVNRNKLNPEEKAMLQAQAASKLACLPFTAALEGKGKASDSATAPPCNRNCRRDNTMGSIAV